MLRRFFAGLAVLSLGAVAFCSLPGNAQVPTAYASGTIAGAGQSVSADLAGQSTCRISFPTSSFVGTLKVQYLAPGGGASWENENVYDNAGIQYGLITNASPSNFTAFPASAGTVQVIATSYTSGSASVIINCSGASGAPAPRDSTYGAQYVIFPTPPQVSIGLGTPLPVATGAPVTQVTAVPSCAPVNYPCGLPTPIPTIAPVAAPTATAGAALPATAQWAWNFQACQYNGSDTNSAPATPSPNIGNAIGCQANFDGSLLSSAPQINSQVSVTANGTYLNSMVDGEATCNIKMNPGSGSSATVSIKNSSSIVFAGPYSVSGSVNTATFQLVTDAYAVMDSFFVAVTSWSGTNPIVITLTCSNAPGVVRAYQASAPWKAVLTDAGGTAWTSASPLPVSTINPSLPAPQATWPVTTPSPIPLAASPAPAGAVVAQGYNAAGAAAPVICTKNVSGSISVTLTQIIATAASKSIYVCNYAVTIYGATAGTVQFKFGTGTACATGTTVVGPAIDFVGSATVLTTYTIGSGVGLVLPPIGPTVALCVVSSVAPSAGHYSVQYEQF